MSCKFQTSYSPLVQPKPFPPGGILVNRRHACRTSAAPRFSAAAPILGRSHSLFCGPRNGGAVGTRVGSVGLDPMATGSGRRVVMGLVAVGFSAYNSAYSSSPAGGSYEEEALVRKTISSYDVVIFSKSYCPYCQMAKDVFKDLGKVPHVIELDEREDGNDIQDAIYSFVGRRTVPQVFIKGKHIGGSDDTIKAYENGSLAKLLGPESA